MSQCYNAGSYGKEANEELAKYWNQRAWDYKNFKEFYLPVDLESEYGLKLQKPEVKTK
jgi:hypothetical protein